MSRRKISLNETPESIYEQYMILKNTPSGEKHAREYQVLEDMVNLNQGALYELIFSGKVTDEDDLYRLIFSGEHKGHYSRKKDAHWIPFLKRVKERVHELPIEFLPDLMEWLGSVHHYWDADEESDA